MNNKKYLPLRNQLLELVFELMYLEIVIRKILMKTIANSTHNFTRYVQSK